MLCIFDLGLGAWKHMHHLVQPPPDKDLLLLCAGKAEHGKG